MTQTWPYTTLGSPSHPAIVFLHGFMGRGKDWHDITDPLSEQYYCICPDLPGHGKNTQGNSESHLDFERISAGLVHLIEKLDLAKIHLVGYSMGGRIALHTAVHQPSLINKLVIESGNPGIIDEKERNERARLDDQRAEKIRQEGLDNFVDKWYQAPLFASLTHHPTLLEQTKQTRKQNDPAWMAKVIADLSPGRQKPLWDKLSSLTMPVMFLTGKLDDKYCNIQRKIKTVHVGKYFVEVPEAGHNVHLESPQKFISKLERFLANEF